MLKTWAFVAATLGFGAVVAMIVVSGNGQRTYLVADSVSSTTSMLVASTTSSSLVVTTSTAAPTTLAPTTVVPTTARPALTSTAQPGQPEGLLAAALPAASELGPGWTALSLRALRDQSTWGPCHSPMWLYDTGAAALVLAYKDGAGHEAAATVTLFAATTTDATAQQQAFTGSPLVTPCLQALVVSDAPRYPWLGTPAESKVTSGSARVALQEPGDSELFTMTVRANGSPQSALWAFTHEYVGRYEVATEVTWCTCAALPPASFQHVVDVAGAHVAALAAKLP